MAHHSLAYGGDPALLAPAVTALRHGRPLHVLTFSSTLWPVSLIAALNRTFPGRAHSVTAVSVADLTSTFHCIVLPPRLLSTVDLFVFDAGDFSSSSYSSIIGSAESILRSALGGMPYPAALMLLRHPAEVATAAAREAAALGSPANALTLLAQFYGVPAVWRGVTPAARPRRAAVADSDGELAALTMSLLHHRGRSTVPSSSSASTSSLPPWVLPSRRMVLYPEASALRTDTPCVAAGRAGWGCVRWLASGAQPSSECIHRVWRERSSPLWPLRSPSLLATALGVPRVALGRVDSALKPMRNGSTGAQVAGGPHLAPCQAGSGTKAQGCGDWTAERAPSLLPPGLLARTRAHEGSTEAWSRVVARLDAGMSVKVCILGGSMSLSGQHGGWPESLVGWMSATWPNAHVTLHNGAIGATGSTFFALCADSRLPSACDLIILEHALNDGEQAQVIDPPSMRLRALVYEVLVRRLLARTPRPVLLFLNWDRIGWCANMEANPDVYVQRFTKGPWRALGGVPWLATPQVAVDLVARWYGIASLAPRNALWHRDCDDFDFRGAVCDSGGLLGCGHLRPIGYQVLSLTISTFIAEAAARVRRVQRHSRAKGGVADVTANAVEEGDASQLPVAMIEEVSKMRSVSNGMCRRGDEMRALTRRVISGDWHFVRRDPRQPPGPDKPGFLSLAAPSTLEIDLGAAPAGVVALGFLRSYDERMGVVRVACVNGCACNETTLHAYSTRRSSVLAFGTVTPTPSEVCTLRLTHLVRSMLPSRAASRFGKASAAAASSPSMPSNSSKFKLIALVVPPFAFNADGDRDFISARGFMS